MRIDDGEGKITIQNAKKSAIRNPKLRRFSVKHKGLIGIGFLVSFLILGLLIDVVRLDQTKRERESILEFCAKEGVKWINHPMMAKEATKQRAREAGIHLNDDQIRVNQRSKELIITYSERIKTRFGWLLGRSEVELQLQIKAILNKEGTSAI
ncbi:MAG: hypothetical protein AB1797_07765 [bacterium]